MGTSETAPLIPIFFHGCQGTGISSPHHITFGKE